MIIVAGFLINASIAQAQVCTVDSQCNPPNGIYCEPDVDRSKPNFCQYNPVKKNFGTIKLPEPLKGLISKDPSGAAGLSKFLSNLIALFYTVATVVLIFILLWGAFEWMTSGGDKEKIQGARQRIISAIIGIILFAAAFAVIQVLGTFTGFEFFVGQK